MTDASLAASFGEELRRWRDARRYSQMALAAEADVSQRHLSFLETGRSKPSRPMVLHLARVLELPLRDQNNLLVTAGYSPEYPERSLDDPDLDEVRHILDTVVSAHGHTPAYVVDRGWDLVLANKSAMSLASLVGIDMPPEVAMNAMRTCFHPDGLRNSIVGWEGFATVLLHRLEREAVARPFDERLSAVALEARTYPGVADLPDRPPQPSGNDLLVPMVVDTPLGRLRLISMIATIGAPFDVTLEELRLETLLPADRTTETILKDLHERLMTS